MTIIHLSSSLGGGGAEKMVFQLARKSHGKIPTMVISLSEVNTIEEKFHDEGIECHFLNINSFRNKTLIKGLNRLNEIVKDINDPLIHAHQYHSCILGVLYNLRFKKIPMVFTLHSSTVDSQLRRIMLYLTKPWRKKDIVFSKGTQKWFLRNSAVIPNGIDFDEFYTDKNKAYSGIEPFQFLFLGRISPEKNPFKTIEVANALIKKGFENFIINIVGDGYKRDELTDLIKENNLESKILFHGFQKDVKAFLKRAHCLILLSSREGLPMVVIEAAACRLPIISTPVGSIPEFLNADNACLSALSDFPDSMMDVINNYDKALARSGRLYEELSGKFSIDKVYEQHLQLYNSVMRKTV